MSNNRNAQRSTSPVNPENSALADELRRNLKGKPTTAGFNRSLPHEIFGFLGDLVKIFVVLLLCISFTLGGFGAGMRFTGQSNHKAHRNRECGQDLYPLR